MQLIKNETIEQLEASELIYKFCVNFFFLLSLSLILVVRIGKQICVLGIGQ